jgi:transcriptional regulator with XRE-family HTH domain
VRNKQPEPSVWSTRLKVAREARGLSQRVLGIKAGIDESVASTRINRYELSVHSPSYSIALKLAAALDVPVAYLYCDDDILAFSHADATTKRETLKLLALTKAR